MSYGPSCKEDEEGKCGVQPPPHAPLLEGVELGRVRDVGIGQELGLEDGTQVECLGAGGARHVGNEAQAVTKQCLGGLGASRSH